jgi:uncharacterized membrane protein
MTWQIALFLNIIFSVIRGSLYKKLVDKIDPILVMMHTNFWGIVFFSSYFVFFNREFPVIYPEMLLLGILFTVSFGAYLKAARISLTQSVVFGSYYLVITLFLAAIFLGEWKLFDIQNISGIKNILGAVMAFISIYLLMTSGSKKEKMLEKNWIKYISLNIILTGFGTFWSKAFLVNHLPIETLFSQYLGGMPIQVIYNKIKLKKLSVDFTYYPAIILCSLMEVVGLSLYYVAFKEGPAMIILPVQTIMITIFTSLSGLIFFKEAHMFKKEKIWGLVIGIVGVGLLVI